MDKIKINNKLINITLIFVIIFLLYKMSSLWAGIINKFISIIAPFVLAFAIAYAVYPLLKKLVDKKVPRWLAVLIIVALVVGFIVLMISLVIPILIDQLGALFSMCITWVQDTSLKYGLDLNFLIKDLSDATSIINKFGESIGNISVAVITTTVDILTFILITFIASIYFLFDMHKIRSKFAKILKRRKDTSYEYVRHLDSEVSKYFGGLGKFILIQFFEYTLVFFLIGHPYYLLLGVLCSVTTIIPYFGGIAANIVAAITAFFISDQLFILTLIVALVCPNIDGYFISPKIYGKTNNVPPLLTIFSVFAGGVLYGMWGIVIALPLTIILLSTYNFYEEAILSKIDNIRNKRDIKQAKQN